MADPRGPGAPRWVKAFAVIAVVVVVMIAVMLLAGGDHGPSRHSSHGTDGATASAGGSPTC